MLQDSVYKHFPEMIAKTKERIAGHEADLAYLKSQPIPPEGFSPMTILNKEYTEKEEAGKAILAACKTVKSPTEVDIGKYMGFDMSVQLGSFSTTHLYLKHKMTYEIELGDSALGNITRVNNALGSIQVRLNDTKARLENYEIQLENAKSELGKPFPQEAELKQKSARLSELNIQLDLDNGDANKTDIERTAEPEPLPAKAPVKMQHPPTHDTKVDIPYIPQSAAAPPRAAVMADAPKTRPSIKAQLEHYKKLAATQNTKQSKDIDKETI